MFRKIPGYVCIPVMGVKGYTITSTQLRSVYVRTYVGDRLRLSRVSGVLHFFSLNKYAGCTGVLRLHKKTLIFYYENGVEGVLMHVCMLCYVWVVQKKNN